MFDAPGFELFGPLFVSIIYIVIAVILFKKNTLWIRIHILLLIVIIFIANHYEVLRDNLNTLVDYEIKEHRYRLISGTLGFTGLISSFVGVIAILFRILVNLLVEKKLILIIEFGIYCVLISIIFTFIRH